MNTKGPKAEKLILGPELKELVEEMAKSIHDHLVRPYCPACDTHVDFADYVLETHRCRECTLGSL